MRPWYPFYPSDYRADTQFLSDKEDLVYRRLLDLYWENQGPLPLNYSKLSTICRVERRTLLRFLSGHLSGFFVIKGSGKSATLVNPRMQAEIEKSDEIHEARVKAGKHGGLAKAKANAIAKALAPQSQSHITKEKATPKVVAKKKVVKKKSTKFIPPKLSDVVAYAQSRNSNVDPKKFYEYFHEGDWKDARGNQVKNWKQKFLTWEKMNGDNGNGRSSKVSRKPTAVERVRAATGLDQQSSTIIDITPHGFTVGEDDKDIW